MFYWCNKLQSIPVGLFDNCPEVINFSDAFNSTAITSIPEGLFKNNKKVIDFSDTFCGCRNITNIPEGLFDNCTEVTNFNGTFVNTEITEIPVGLFDNNKKVNNFGRLFYGCSKVTSESPYTVIQVDGVETKVHLYERSQYPEHFTAPTSYSSCFRNCTGLTDYDSILTTWK